MPFVPGKSGNPGGRPKLPEDVQAMRKAALEQIVRAYHKFSTVTKDTGPAEAVNPIEAGMATVIREFARTGDTDGIRHVWDRVIGKPQQQIEVEGSVGGLVIVVDDDEDIQAEQ